MIQTYLYLLQIDLIFIENSEMLPGVNICYRADIHIDMLVILK